MKSIDAIEQTKLFADLIDLNCELNHGGWVAPEPGAVDYLVLPVGITTTLPGGVKQQEISGHYAVPICRECAKTLYERDKTWVLVFCTKCGENHWIIRELANMWYPLDEMVVWLTACQFCIEQGEQVGLYFCDKEEK